MRTELKSSSSQSTPMKRKPIPRSNPPAEIIEKDTKNEHIRIGPENEGPRKKELTEDDFGDLQAFIEDHRKNDDSIKMKEQAKEKYVVIELTSHPNPDKDDSEHIVEEFDNYADAVVCAEYRNENAPEYKYSASPIYYVRNIKNI